MVIAEFQEATESTAVVLAARIPSDLAALVFRSRPTPPRPEISFRALSTQA